MILPRGETACLSLRNRKRALYEPSIYKGGEMSKRSQPFLCDLTPPMTGSQCPYWRKSASSESVTFYSYMIHTHSLVISTSKVNVPITTTTLHEKLRLSSERTGWGDIPRTTSQGRFNSRPQPNRLGKSNDKTELKIRIADRKEVS